MTSFNDIFKKKFTSIEAFEKIPIIEVLICIAIALMVSLIIFYVYKKTFKGVVYSHNFNASLVLMCLLTSLVILTISSNVVLSLGMVGALSIVRFRTALKDPMDIVYIFWSIVAGIAIGAGIYSVAVVGTIAVSIILIFMSKVKYNDTKYMLIIHFFEEADDEIKIILSKLNYILKSKTVSKACIELSVEVNIKNNNSGFINDLSSIVGVKDVSLVNYNGDYAD